MCAAHRERGHALTGNDEQSVRGLYRDKKGIVIAFKPILHSNYMPQVDSDDSAARNRLWVARFGSTFPADLVEPDVHRRRFPRIENLRDTMRAWAPYHFLLMLEALRDFRRRNCVLPVGAQQIEGSLMHQEIVAQTPEGRLRAWVESNYTHVPLREKDTGARGPRSSRPSLASTRPRLLRCTRSCSARQLSGRC